MTEGTGILQYGVTGVAFSTDGKWLVTASRGKLTWQSTDDFRVKKSLKHRDMPETLLCFSPDDAQLYGLSQDGSVLSAVNLESGKVEFALTRVALSKVLQMAVDAKGEALICWCSNGFEKYDITTDLYGHATLGPPIYKIVKDVEHYGVGLCGRGDGRVASILHNRMGKAGILYWDYFHKDQEDAEGQDPSKKKYPRWDGDDEFMDPAKEDKTIKTIQVGHSDDDFGAFACAMSFDASLVVTVSKDYYTLSRVPGNNDNSGGGDEPQQHVKALAYGNHEFFFSRNNKRLAAITHEGNKSTLVVLNLPTLDICDVIHNIYAITLDVVTFTPDNRWIVMLFKSGALQRFPLPDL